jgi:hypothetical protein
MVDFGADRPEVPPPSPALPTVANIRATVERMLAIESELKRTAAVSRERPDESYRLLRRLPDISTWSEASVGN